MLYIFDISTSNGTVMDWGFIIVFTNDELSVDRRYGGCLLRLGLIKAGV